MITPLSEANSFSFLRTLSSELFVRESRYFSKLPIERLLTIVFIGPIEGGAIERCLKPMPINAIASKGSPAISPQSDMGILPLKHFLTKSRRNERTVEAIGSYL